MNKLNLLNKLERMELDKKKIFLFTIIFLVALYIDFTFLVSAQLKSIKTLSPKIIKLKKDIDNLAKDLTIMQGLKSKQIAKIQDVTLKAKKIISREQIPLLLQDISDMANKNNVKIIKILPSKELKSLEEEKISLDLSCDYHRCGQFINALEDAEKFMAVEEMKIVSDTNNYFQQNVKIVLKTHVKK